MFRKIRSGARRNFSLLPKAATTLARLPIAAAGAGISLSAYVHYQLDGASKWYNEVKLKTFEFWKALWVDDEEETEDEKEVSEEGANEFEEDDRKKKLHVVAAEKIVNKEESLVGLTKTLIEIRNLLKKVESTDHSLTLPSIVVIGSQSSGKSSVLEAIVGHSFLPKGKNMVTRRPIELTLIHSVNNLEFAEFPQLKLGKILSFEKVQQTLTELNMAVSDEECVSSSPIELVIHSPNVPDLTLVDLPGYIQIASHNQPPKLKEKIAALCESYISKPNIILAVCAADVDLANSEGIADFLILALRASKRVDPKGDRTIGVLTKMDLIEPKIGQLLLNNLDYPLSLGYIGVVNSPSASSQSSVIIAEKQFFKKHSDYNNMNVGSGILRKKLMEVLEIRMSESLESIVESVKTELDEARYQFKVHYNDRSISPESYVAECIDSLKLRFKQFSRQFDKQIVKEEIRMLLLKKMTKLLEDEYWSDCRNSSEHWDGPNADEKLTQISSKLTRSGVGKASVQLVFDMITEKLTEITMAEPWSFHADARQQVLDFAMDLLKSKFNATIDQVENTIKPYKFEVDVSDLEWKDGLHSAADTLSRQLYRLQTKVKDARSINGRRKLKNAMKFLQYVDNHPDQLVNPPFSVEELTLAKEALLNQRQMHMISERLSTIKSRQCSSVSSKSICPEVFLSVVSEKLASTAVMFIYIELLNEFFFQLPRQIDNKLYYSLGRENLIQFCKENPAIDRHLTIQERKQTLEAVMGKLSSIFKNQQ